MMCDISSTLQRESEKGRLGREHAGLCFGLFYRSGRRVGKSRDYSPQGSAVYSQWMSREWTLK
jgi:hypothetical protein